MITAVFYKKGRDFSGFRVSGHAGYADSGSDIVCASVSSAVQLTANLVTDYFKIKATAKAGKNVITLKIAKTCEEEAREIASVLIKGLKEHLELISQQYERTIKTKISEV